MVTAPPSSAKKAKPTTGTTPAKSNGKSPAAPKRKADQVPPKPEVSADLDPAIYVTASKLTESLQAVQKLQKLFDAKQIEAKPLFDEDSKMVLLQVELKKVPVNFSTFIHSVALPRHWRHQMDHDVCLIVGDVNKEPLTDRDLDLEQTKGKYFDVLEAANATTLIKDILPTRQLRNEFRPHALKAKLSSEYGAFLCDRKLLRNKQSFLSRFLGKAFWLDQKRVPLPIDLSVKASELRPQIEAKLNETQIYVSGKGSSLAVRIGSLVQSQAHLLANLQAVLAKVKEIFASNVRSLTVKTEKSLAVTFYMDLASENEIKLVNHALDETKEKFVEDDFDFLTNASVRVYRDGKIQVRSKKRKLNPEEDKANQDEEVPEPAEKKMIRAINRSFLRGDHDWVRHKVPSLRKVARRNIKRLPGGSKSRRGPKGLSGKRFFSTKEKKTITTANTPSEE